jgi:response regulator of citrate/malate metabolism
VKIALDIRIGIRVFENIIVEFIGIFQLTNEDVRRITDFQYNTTMTNRDIAKEFDISRSTPLKYVANYKKSLKYS